MSALVPETAAFDGLLPALGEAAALRAAALAAEEAAILAECGLSGHEALRAALAYLELLPDGARRALAREAAFRLTSREVARPDAISREVARRYADLVSYEVVRVTLATEDAAREALLGARDDGEAWEAIARGADAPATRTTAFADELPPGVVAAKLRSAHPGEPIGPCREADGFSVYRLDRRRSPTSTTRRCGPTSNGGSSSARSLPRRSGACASRARRRSDDARGPGARARPHLPRAARARGPRGARRRLRRGRLQLRRDDRPRGGARRRAFRDPRQPRARRADGEGGEEITLATLGAGEVFGEIALLRGERRSATVRASGPLSALRLAKEDLEKLLERRPRLRGWFAMYVRMRLTESFLRRLSGFRASRGRRSGSSSPRSCPWRCRRARP